MVFFIRTYPAKSFIKACLKKTNIPVFIFLQALIVLLLFVSHSEIEAQNRINKQEFGDTLKSNSVLKKKGYYSHLSGGILIGSNQFGEDTRISFQYVQAYQFNRFAGIGVGLGADFYYLNSVFPLFIQLESEFLKTKVSPYIYASGGYGFAAPVDPQAQALITQKGGLMYEFGGGIKAFRSRKKALRLAVAYHFQEVYSEHQTWWTTERERTLQYRRIKVALGYQF